MRRAVRAGAVLLPLAGLGCSTAADDRLAMAFVDPATYRYHSCEQLDANLKGVVVTQRVMKERIDIAERGTGGVLVSIGAYQGEYLAAVGNQRLIEQAAKEKNCPPPLPAPEQKPTSAGAGPARPR